MATLTDEDGVFITANNALFSWYKALKSTSKRGRKDLVDWIKSGFAATGIFPFNPEVFSFKDFVAAGRHLGQVVTKDTMDSAKKRQKLSTDEEAAILSEIGIAGDSKLTPQGQN